MGEYHGERFSGEVLVMLAERFKVFSEPMRLKLVYSLMDGEKSVSQLVRDTGGLQANVSKHLGMLLDAGVVGRRKEGLHTCYKVTDGSVYEICDLMCGSIQDRLAASLDNFSSFTTREAQPRERSD